MTQQTKFIPALWQRDTTTENTDATDVTKEKQPVSSPAKFDSPLGEFVNQLSSMEEVKTPSGAVFKSMRFDTRLVEVIRALNQGLKEKNITENDLNALIELVRKPNQQQQQAVTA